MEERSWLRYALRMGLISFLVTVGFGAANMILPYYLLALLGRLHTLPDVLSRVNASGIALEYGSLVSAFMATRAFLAFISGGLSDALGRKRLILLGLLIYTVVGALYAAVTSFTQLLLLRALQGVASALVWPVAETLLVELVPPMYRTRALSIYVMSMQFGQILGPLFGVGAYLAARHLFDGNVMAVLRAPFVILALMNLAGLVVALGLPETLRKRTRLTVRSALGFLEILRESSGEVRSSILALITNSGINGLAMGIFVSIVIIYVMSRVTANLIVLGTVFAAASIVGMLAAYPLARRADRLTLHGKKAMVVGLAVLARTTWMLIAFARDVITLFIAMTLANLGFAVLMPLLRVLQAELVPPERRGALFGAQQAFFNMGMVIGPMLGAALYRAWSGLQLLGGLLTGGELVFIIATLLGYIGAAIIAVWYKPVSVAATPQAQKMRVA